MSYSLQARALLIASLVLAAFLGGTGVVLNQAFRDSAEAAMRDGLEAYAETLEAAILKDHLAGLETLPQTLREKLAEPTSGLYAILTRRSDDRRLWVSDSAKDLDIPWPSLAEFWTARLDPVLLPNGKSLYILSLNLLYQKPRSRVATHYILQIAETLDDKESYYYSRVNQVRRRLWRWFGGTAVALLLLQALILRRSFAPLRRVEADLRRIEAGRAERLSGSYPRELQGLTENLNALLDQADAHLARYRDALGDLAHSLKTPLAVLRGALAEPGGGEGSAQLAREQIDGMNRIIEYQLKRAAASGRSHLAPPVAVADKVGQVVAALNKVYADKRVICVPAIDAALVFRGDEGDLLEMLGNLLDNAYKWCRSRVQLRADCTPDGGLELRVEDDGPGIPEELAERLMQRGERADPSVPGHGLGLAIAASIARAYGGWLTIERGTLGGALIRVTHLK